VGELFALKAAFHTLGCKTNHYETDAIARRFTDAGFERVDFDQIADVYIINTCTVTGEADRKSRQMLRRAKRLAPQAVVVAMGCHAELSDAKSYADIVIGTHGKARALELVQDYLQLSHTTGNDPAENIPGEDLFEELGIVDRQSECRAHIKIEDGCNSFCSYCAIPLARGRIRSRSEAAILAEGRALAMAGYREVVLTGIHVCSYGADRGEGSDAVMVLANRLAMIEGIDRIRLGSLEPQSITPSFIALARENPKLCPHFHLSLQSGSDTVLQRMSRRYSTGQFRTVANNLRAAFPQASLTTDVIVGFPGETEAEFAETLAFCAEIGFARMHIFRYSPRKGTRAAAMKDQVAASISAARSLTLQELADNLAGAFHASQLNRPQQVLVETHTESGAAEGYTAAYVPVRIEPGQELTPGQIFEVVLVRADSHFLYCTDAKPC
jgi:threonylcarbamoyladenosine tRNA methylthiotransferase MtaB